MTRRIASTGDKKAGVFTQIIRIAIQLTNVASVLDTILAYNIYTAIFYKHLVVKL